MGQYYEAVLQTYVDKKNISPAKRFESFADGEWQGFKLTEHSWWANPFVLSIASRMFRKKCRLAWLGDYAADTVKYENLSALYPDSFPEAEKFDDAWGKGSTALKYNGFRLEGKCFINHDRKEFIDLDAYYKHLSKQRTDGWVINPLPLMTAVGNGRGGGDYHDENPNYEMVGTWAWDIVELTDKDPVKYRWDCETRAWVPDGMKTGFDGYVDITNKCLFKED